MVTVVGANVTATAINAATNVDSPWPWGLEAVRAHPFQWSAAFTVAMAVVTVAAWWWQRESGGGGLLPPVPAPPDWVVDRPAEVDDVVAALRRHDGGTVGITTALHGAGGFGKTTLAQVVCADRRVRWGVKSRTYLTRLQIPDS